jgi:Plasmid pRiA4b ORF-3-like protein
LAGTGILEAYQLPVWLCEISPLIWRRHLVRGDSSIAALLDTLQIVMGWDDTHLHRFRVERRLPWDRKRIYPVGIGGTRAEPP